MLRIALLQALPAGWDQQANLRKGEELCRLAKERRADVALFPEMWNIGYRFFDTADEQARAEWIAQAVGPEDEFVRHFRALACELNMAVALTYLERWDPAPRNAVSLIDRRGDILMTYAKVHTCDMFAERTATPGDAFRVCTLDTKEGAVQVGAMICYDREFPERARILMLQGAEIILTPNACGLEVHRLGQFRARAYENMVGLAMTNYPAPHCNGHSIAVHPIAFGEDGKSRDITIIEAGEEEGLYVAAFDIKAIRDYRARSFWGNAYRKTRTYGLLTSPEVRAPFIRRDARR